MLDEPVGRPSVDDAGAAAMAHTINLHVAGRLEEAARLLREQGADPYRVRAGRVRMQPPGRPPRPISELLDVDREYRELATAGKLQLIAPRRFNPAGKAWLPIPHTTRGGHHYTALYSNTARVHRAGKTHDWVVLYEDGINGERLHPVITASHGGMRGRRVIAGREGECEQFYAALAA